MTTSTQTTLPPAGWYLERKLFYNNEWNTHLTLIGTAHENNPNIDSPHWWTRERIETEYKKGNLRIQF